MMLFYLFLLLCPLNNIKPSVPCNLVCITVISKYNLIPEVQTVIHCTAHYWKKSSTYCNITLAKLGKVILLILTQLI